MNPCKSTLINEDIASYNYGVLVNSKALRRDGKGKRDLRVGFLQLLRHVVEVVPIGDRGGYE